MSAPEDKSSSAAAAASACADGAGREQREGLFLFEPAFLGTDEAAALLAFCDEQDFGLYPFRGRPLKRSPKVEFKASADVGAYRWGQAREAYAWAKTPFPPQLAALAGRLAALHPDSPPPNHIIIMRYSDGKIHHIPWHSDRQEGTAGMGAKDIAAGTAIYNLVVCTAPRRFQMARPADIPDSADGHGDPPPSKLVFDCAMPSGSMIMLTARGNREFKHRVPKEPTWSGARYSLVFRTIKSASPQPAGKAAPSRKRKHPPKA